VKEKCIFFFIFLAVRTPHLKNKARHMELEASLLEQLLAELQAHQQHARLNHDAH
jgi:hypothetical protein